MSDDFKHSVRVGPGFLAPVIGWLPQGLIKIILRFDPGRTLDAINKPSVKTFKPRTGYRWHWGFIAWLFHRLTGVALAAYLVLHLWVLSNLARGPEAFDGIMATFSNPFTRILEIGLLGIVVIHTINGLRIVLMDYGPMAEKESYVKYLAITFLVIAVIVVAGGFRMLMHIIGLH